MLEFHNVNDNGSGNVDGRFYDSPPAKPAIFFNKRFVPGRYEEGCYEKDILTYFVVSRRTISR